MEKNSVRIDRLELSRKEEFQSSYNYPHVGTSQNTSSNGNFQSFKIEIKSSGHFYAETLNFYLSKHRKKLFNWAENEQK